MNTNSEERIVKIPLPVVLIREIDESIVSGLGGYSTRTEFFRDAAEGLLLELRYEPAPEGPIRDASGIQTSAPASAAPPKSGRHSEANEKAQGERSVTRRSIASLDETALHLRAEGAPVGKGVGDVDDEPLFGMHNRDFPSLWVAYRLARRAAAGPVPFEAFVAEATEEAWSYAEALGEWEQEGGQKLTALFPTNRSKPQAASQGFRAFAIGSIARTDHSIRLEGPLFSWRICGVELSPGDELMVGITSDGWRLLCNLDGVSAAVPHAPELARTFLGHLRAHSPGDWWGFQTVLSAVSEQPNRLELVEVFQSARPDWTPSVAATNVQGYVARAREWGLVEPKQAAGRYRLTEFGERYLTESNNHTNEGETNE